LISLPAPPLSQLSLSNFFSPTSSRFIVSMVFMSERLNAR
jgi:hypothetical protein